MARFIVVNVESDGAVQFSPMKEWLRQNPEFIPENMDATASTSRQLLSGLKKTGWQFEETDSEVRLFQPGHSNDKEKVESLLGGTEDSNDSDDEPAFGLEKQLRDFLADNIEMININGKKLKLYVDPTGQDGVEYKTAVGFIDVLGIDDQGNFYVFELKRDIGSDKVVGQISRYMGWVKNTIGKGKEVFGVIVAKQIGRKLRYAASIVPQISLYEYKVEFQLNASNEILE